MRARSLFAIACSVATLVSAVQAEAQVSAANTFMGVVLGPNKNYPGFYASDLGIPVEWPTAVGEYTFLLFGDTHTSITDTTGPVRNDALGFFAPAAAPNYNTLISLGPPASAGFSGMLHAVRGGTTDLILDGAKTPIAGFNGAGRPYANFLRGLVYAKCTSNADCNGLTCDKQMGWLFSPQVGEETFRTCWKNVNPGCTHIDNNANKGICRDPTAAVANYSGNGETARIVSSAMVSEIGYMQSPVTHFTTASFVTNRFMNAAMRATTSLTNYERPIFPPGTAPFPTAVYMWGRSTFFSNATRSAPAEVYLARANVPVTPTTALSWFYYSNGAWLQGQTNATPLPATGGWGDGPINSMSIVYLKNAAKWIMLYGGGIPVLWDVAFGGGISAGSTYSTVFPDPNLSGIKIRTAPHPWGPWTQAYNVLKPNDTVISGKLCTGPLPPPGVVCNPLGFPEIGNGVLYGANIVDRWTTSAAGTATIGWLLSTWNPYQVDQIKTVLTGL